MSSHKIIIDKCKQDLLNKQNVVGVGFGMKKRRGKMTGEESVVVLVEKKLPVHKVKNKDLVPQSVDKFKTDVIEVGQLYFLGERTTRLRPAKPGVSIGHYKISAGTMGAVVRDKDSGKPLILSNNHVLANISNGRDSRAQKGDPILQPGSYDNGNRPDDVIGYLERYIPIERGRGKPDCKVAIAVERLTNFIIHIFRQNYNFKLFKQGSNNIVDCAVARPVSNDDIDPEIIEIGKVEGVKEAEVGMEIQKSGRTTGLTTGKVVAVSTTVNVNMSENETATFDDQFVCTPLSQAGDSGSLVLDMDNNAVGLLFAGSEKATVCNKISNVMNKLSVKF